MPDDEVLYELADLFRVFGDSTRIKILYAPVSYTHLDVYKRQAKVRAGEDEEQAHHEG